MWRLSDWGYLHEDLSMFGWDRGSGSFERTLKSKWTEERSPSLYVRAVILDDTHETKRVELKAQGGEETLSLTLLWAVYAIYGIPAAVWQVWTSTSVSNGLLQLRVSDDSCYPDSPCFINVLLSQSSELDFTCSSRLFRVTNADLCWDEQSILKCHMILGYSGWLLGSCLLGQAKCPPSSH